MIKCPLCQKAYKEMEDLYLHVDKEHGDIIPEGWTASRYLYFVKTKKEHGKCVVCKQPTGWNNQTNKYHRFCTNPKCKEEYRKIFEERMIGKHGKISLLDDPEHQKKMLSNRSISGTYKWSNGGETTYTGSYELDFLRMLDNLLDFEAGDVMAPSPHTYWYVHEGVRRFYIPDFYIPSLNLEIEVKDGGDNPNNHYKIQAVDKVKEKLKDEVMTSQSKVSYIKVVNKQYGSFFTFLNKAKRNFINGFKEKPIFILENVANMAPIVSSKTNKVEYENDNVNDTEIVEESLVVSSKDIHLNIDKWGSDKFNNILFITGFSGSGKSTKAMDLKSANVIIWSMDDIENGFVDLDDNKKHKVLADLKISDICDKVPAYSDVLDKEKVYELSDSERELIAIEVVKYLIERSTKLFTEFKFILEGYQLYSYIPPSFMYDKPIMIKGTSATKSALNRVSRDGKFKDSTQFKTFCELMHWNIIDNPRINSFASIQKKYVTKEATTKFNEEDLQDHHGIAAVIVDNRGRILMQDHVKYNFWTIPVGKVKHNETVEDGLKTELKEELDIIPTKYYELFSAKRNYEREGKMVTVTQHVFFISEYKGTVKNNEPDKHRSIKWMYPDEIMHKPTLSDATKDYLEYIKLNGNPKDKQEELIPVYVLLTYTNSLMARGIKFVTNQPYSHAGISLDSSLTSIFTYGRKEVKDNCKFAVESILDGALGAVKDSTPYSLYVTFFKKYQFETLKERIENIKNDISKHGYSYIGLVNFALGKETYNDYRMFCSQFVADVIKAGDPSRVKKHTSRYSPSDLSKVKGMHFITKGILGKYDQKKVDQKVDGIKRSLTIKTAPNPLIESALECDNDNLSATDLNHIYGNSEALDRLTTLCESHSLADFVDEINNVEDIELLNYCAESIERPEYLSKVRRRISALESTQQCESDKHLYIIIESTGTRLVNNRLNIFNINDNDTIIYTVEECKEGTTVSFNVDKYRRKGLNLVQESCENSLPDLTDEKIHVSYKISSEEPNIIKNIRDNFTNVKAWKPMAPLTTLNLNDTVAMESYVEDMLNSINIDIDAVEIKRFK